MIYIFILDKKNKKKVNIFERSIHVKIAKRKLKILSFCVALILLLSSLVSCSFFKDKGNGNDKTGKQEYYIPQDKMFDVYSNWQYSSFAKLRILSSDKDIYYKEYHETIDCIIYKCEVVEDYYGILEAGESVDLVVGIASYVGVNLNFDEKEVRDILDSEYILAYMTEPCEQKYICFEDYSIHDGKMYSETDIKYKVFPIREGKLDVASVDNLHANGGIDASGVDKLYENIPSFSKYLRQGMTEEEIKESISKLDIDQETDYRNSLFSLTTNKFKTELLELVKPIEQIAISIDYFDPYLERMEFTVINNSDQRVLINLGKIFKDVNGVWDSDSIQGSNPLINKETDEKSEAFGLQPGEECTYKVGLGTLRLPGNATYKLPISIRKERVEYFSELTFSVSEWEYVE